MSVVEYACLIDRGGNCVPGENQLLGAITYFQATHHSFHEAYETPKGYCVVLLNGVDGSKKIAHSLDITEISVILVVRQKHIFHLLHVNIGATVRKW